MKELPSPVYAEQMKVAQFSSLVHFRTKEPVFGKDAPEATNAAADGLMVAGEQPTRTTDETVTKTTDVGQ